MTIEVIAVALTIWGVVLYSMLYKLNKKVEAVIKDLKDKE